MAYRYVIGSGWWCSAPELDSRDRAYGDDHIRKAEFHHRWYESVCRNSDPQKIFIVDSASPVPPPLNRDDLRLEYVRLNINPGHCSNHVGHLSGSTRAMILGMEYAAQCDTDYFVYVEQDALLKGAGIIEHCIDAMRRPLMFGDGRGTPQPVQQSLFIVKREAIDDFVARLKAIDATDMEITPEEKFAIASLTHFRKTAEYVARYHLENWRINRLKRMIYDHFGHFDVLPVGYGRQRPIDFSDSYYYFQHGSREELDQHEQFESAADTP